MHFPFLRLDFYVAVCVCTTEPHRIFPRHSYAIDRANNAVVREYAVMIKKQFRLAFWKICETKLISLDLRQIINSMMRSSQFLFIFVYETYQNEV